MTLQDAITALLEEYRLEEFTEFWRDDAKGDPLWPGMSWEHPRVQRFKEICETLRTAAHNGANDASRRL